MTYFNGGRKNAYPLDILENLESFLIAELAPTKVIYIVGNDQFPDDSLINSASHLLKIRKETETLIARLIQ